MTEELRSGVVRGVSFYTGVPRFEVYEPATGMLIEIRHGFSLERGLNFYSKRAALYGRILLFSREQFDGIASYVFKGFEHGDDL